MWKLKFQRSNETLAVLISSKARESFSSVVQQPPAVRWQQTSQHSVFPRPCRTYAANSGSYQLWQRFWGLLFDSSPDADQHVNWLQHACHQRQCQNLLPAKHQRKTMEVLVIGRRGCDMFRNNILTVESCHAKPMTLLGAWYSISGEQASARVRLSASGSRCLREREAFLFRPLGCAVFLLFNIQCAEKAPQKQFFARGAAVAAANPSSSVTAYFLEVWMREPVGGGGGGRDWVWAPQRMRDTAVCFSLLNPVVLTWCLPQIFPILFIADITGKLSEMQFCRVSCSRLNSVFMLLLSAQIPEACKISFTTCSLKQVVDQSDENLHRHIETILWIM